MHHMTYSSQQECRDILKILINQAQKDFESIVTIKAIKRRSLCFLTKHKVTGRKTESL